MVMKNWDPLVFLPALAMDRSPSLVCFCTKFSSKGERKSTIVFQINALGMPTVKSLAIDGLATGAVVPGEITALKHELGDHTVEGGTLVAETILSSRKFPEVSCGFGDDVIIQLENDSTSGLTSDGNVKLYEGKKEIGHHENQKWHEERGRTKTLDMFLCTFDRLGSRDEEIRS